MTSEELREHIANLMIRSEWRGGGSVRQLVEETGMRLETVRRLAREASAGLRLSSGDLPSLVAEEMARLDMVFEKAMHTVRVMGTPKDGFTQFPAPDLKAAIGAVELKARLAGALNVGAQQKPAPHGTDDFDKMTPAEQVAKLREAADELERTEGQKRKGELQ